MHREAITGMRRIFRRKSGPGDSRNIGGREPLTIPQILFGVVVVVLMFEIGYYAIMHR